MEIINMKKRRHHPAKLIETALFSLHLLQMELGMKQEDLS
jgi:hypothetical protein